MFTGKLFSPPLFGLLRNCIFSKNKLLVTTEEAIKSFRKNTWDVDSLTLYFDLQFYFLFNGIYRILEQLEHFDTY